MYQALVIKNPNCWTEKQSKSSCISTCMNVSLKVCVSLEEVLWVRFKYLFVDKLLMHNRKKLRRCWKLYKKVYDINIYNNTCKLIYESTGKLMLNDVFKNN